MKKNVKIIIIVVVVLLLLGLVPNIDKLNDGGSTVYKSLLPGIYEITSVHKTNMDSKDGYETGVIIKIFNHEIVNNVSYEVKDITEEEIISLHSYVTEKLIDEYSWDNFVDSYINVVEMKIHLVLKDNSEEQINWFKTNVIDTVFVVYDKEV